MSAYRFCRTDDIGLLVDALNRCWAPHFPAEPLTTAESFKRSIRELQVWCSSCMVAFAGSDPIGVLIGAKRASETLIYRIAVHPDHVRQGHARHMLASLGSKLAILGPPRMIAEVPAAFDSGSNLFASAGFAVEATLTDYVLEPATSGEREDGRHGRLMIPVTIEDLAANGLLEETSAQTCWERSTDTLKARKAEIEGLALASDEWIESFILYERGGDVMVLRSMVEDGGGQLRHLLAQSRGRGKDTRRFVKVHPAEIPAECLAELGFRKTVEHVLYAAAPSAD